MRILKVLLLLLIAAVCCSCSWFSRKPAAIPPSPPQVQGASPAVVSPSVNSDSATDSPRSEKVKAAADAYKKDDITLLIKPDTQLNRYQNNGHTLFICIYQLKDPNGFNQLIEEPDGIEKLLECRRFDSTVANAKRLVIQPGQNYKDTRDRAQGARYIGIATGYYGRGKEKLTHLELLPSGRVDETTGTTIQIELGPYEIESVTVQ